MPLPLLFIGVAAATGAVGVGKTVKAGIDTSNASHINKSANEIVEAATKKLNDQRLACGNALTKFGEEKLFILNSTITQFLECFVRIKNVDFTQSENVDDLSSIHIDEQEIKDISVLVNYAVSLAGGAVAGSAGGALVAFGAYGAAQAFAFASTGTAISALSGAAATNATLAFFGGGSLAAGGLGMAGGTAVLGGLVAGPALMIMGLVVGHAAKKNLELANTNHEEAAQIAAEMDKASLQCEAIRRRTYMLYNLLARLDTYFLPMIYKMEDIVASEGEDYRNYSAESKRLVASCASTAVAVKAVLDTPILTEDGALTEASEVTLNSLEGVLDDLSDSD